MKWSTSTADRPSRNRDANRAPNGHGRAGVPHHTSRSRASAVLASNSRSATWRAASISPSSGSAQLLETVAIHVSRSSSPRGRGQSLSRGDRRCALPISVAQIHPLPASQIARPLHPGPLQRAEERELQRTSRSTTTGKEHGMRAARQSGSAVSPGRRGPVPPTASATALARVVGYDY